MPINTLGPAMSHLRPAGAYTVDPQEGSKPSAQANQSAPAQAAVIRSDARAPRLDAAPALRQALVASAQAKAASPPLTEVALPDRHPEADRLIDKYVKAQNAGVDLSKRSFFMKCGLVAANAAVLAVAIAATVLSVGALSPLTVPAIVLLSANLATASGDALCCYKNWQAAKDQANGGSKERLIGGDSCITHASMKLCRYINDKVGGKQAHADLAAKVLSAGLKIGLGVATAVCTAGLSQAANFAKITLYAAKGVGIAVNTCTIALRGIHERQFLTDVKRTNMERVGLIGERQKAERQPEGYEHDRYQTAIPRSGPRMQRLNSVANDGLALMIKDKDAFAFEVAGSPQRKAAAASLTQLLSTDAERFSTALERGAAISVRPDGAGLSVQMQPDHPDYGKAEAGRNGDFVATSPERGQHFARFAKGATEDVGNAAVGVLLAGLAIAGIAVAEI